MLLLLLFVSTLCAVSFAFEWGLVIDAGSSGSRLHIYYWNQRDSYTVDPLIKEYTPSNSSDAKLLSLNPGLSSFAANPSQASAQVAQLVEQGKRWVPSDKWESTPVILRATAGLRLLAESDQNAILDAVKRYLLTTPFVFRNSSASIASGEQEAVWSWVCANYLAGLLSSPQSDTSAYVSTFELGGASTQIEFLSKNQIMGSQFDITVFGTKLTFYAHSFLKFGKDQFRDRLRALAVDKQAPSTSIQFPCYYAGYSEPWTFGGVSYNFSGTGNWSECYYNYTLEAMGLNVECLQPPCSFFGTYQPTLPPANQQFWGVSAFFYTLAGQGLVAGDGVWTGNVPAIEAANKVQCSKSWASALNDSTDAPKYVATYCLDGTLMISLLRAYGAENYNITYAQLRYGQSVGWTLGALIDELSLLPISITDNAGSKTQNAWGVLLSFVGVVILRLSA